MPAPYLSEIKYLGGGTVDFIEVAVDAGTNPANIQVVIYHPSGAVRTTNALGTLDNTVAGTDIYLIDAATSATFNGVHANGAVALVVNGVVTHFHSFGGTVTASNGPAAGMTSTAIGTTGQGGSLESTDGTTYTATSTPTPAVVPCFATCTMIETAKGPRAVETLQAGDLVSTQDRGYQPLIWAGKRELARRDAAGAAVRIPAGLFGGNVFSSSLTVSPNHRLLISGSKLELLFGDADALIAAKHLVGWRGIHTTELPKGQAFHHLLFENHEIIFSGGIASESLHLGQMALLGFEPSVRRALYTRFAGDLSTPTARPVLTSLEAPLALRSLENMPLAA